MELSNTVISLTYTPHSPSCTEAPSTYPVLLVCQSWFLFSIHQFNFFSPLRIYHLQGLTTSTSSLLSSSSVPQQEKENSVGVLEQGTRNAAFNIGYTLPKLSYRNR